MLQRAEILSRGNYRVRFAEGHKDLDATHILRTLCFGTGQTDRDAFDSQCAHVLLEHTRSGELVCSFRVLELRNGEEIPNSYSGQFYDLSRLASYSHPMIEVGRFCSHPGWSDPDILRLAWVALTRIVDSSGAQMLFGCSSFAGPEVKSHLDAFAVLRRRYLAPERWRPLVKAANAVRFDHLPRHDTDDARAVLAVPALLRSYLMMGGWVSDHAVVDAELNTLHVFTGLEIGAIPPSRQRLLRGLAG